MPSLRRHSAPKVYSAHAVIRFGDRFIFIQQYPKFGYLLPGSKLGGSEVAALSLSGFSEDMERDVSYKFLGQKLRENFGAQNGDCTLNGYLGYRPGKLRTDKGKVYTVERMYFWSANATKTYVEPEKKARGRPAVKLMTVEEAGHEVRSAAMIEVLKDVIAKKPNIQQ